MTKAARKMITVRATKAGRPCPKEARPRVRYYEHSSGERRDRFAIYHDEPVTVPTSRYYRRRIVRGDLELVGETTPKPLTTPKPAAKPKATRTTTKSGDNR